MTSLVIFAQTTTYDLTPESWRLPHPIWTAFTALNKVHYLWRWYRKAELYRQPDNLFQLFTGHLINVAIGDSLLLRVAAQTLLVATRLLECSEQQSILNDEARQWCLALKGEYPKPLHFSWDSTKGHILFSPTTVYKWKISFHAMYYRIHRTALLTFSLFFESFKLTMKMMDLIDVFSWNPTIKDEAINESIINLKKWLSSLVDNKEKLLSGLQKNKLVVKRLLKATPFSYEQLEEAVTRALETTELVDKQIKTIAQIGNGILWDMGKRIVNGTSIVIGFGAHV